MRRAHDMPFGAAIASDGSARFRLWAPAAPQVDLVLGEGGARRTLALEAMADNRHKRVLRVRTSCNSGQKSVRIEVSDTGRGFPKEYQDSLFLPYFSTRKGGTGLGLAIVRQIIADHHGCVYAEPNTPVGTRIVIDLPLAPAWTSVQNRPL